VAARIPGPVKYRWRITAPCFSDESRNFDRSIEVLREPIETGHITPFPAPPDKLISRRASQLIAGDEPLSCGYLGDASGRCHCTSRAGDALSARVSGPLLDRIDMHLEVPESPMSVLRKGSPNGEESSAQDQGTRRCCRYLCRSTVAARQYPR